MKAILHKLFPYAPYLNEYIGFEDDVREGETPLEAADRLRKLAEQSHRDRYPDFYKNDQFPNETTQHLSVSENPINPSIEAIIADIQKCTSISEKNSLGVETGLLSYQHLCATERIKTAYDLKYQQLNELS